MATIAAISREGWVEMSRETFKALRAAKRVGFTCGLAYAVSEDGQVGAEPVNPDDIPAGVSRIRWVQA